MQQTATQNEPREPWQIIEERANERRRKKAIERTRQAGQAMDRYYKGAPDWWKYYPDD